MTKRQFSKLSTTEKGIRQIGPATWGVRIFVDRYPDTGELTHLNRKTDAKLIKTNLPT